MILGFVLVIEISRQQGLTFVKGGRYHKHQWVDLFGVLLFQLINTFGRGSKNFSKEVGGCRFGWIGRIFLFIHVISVRVKSFLLYMSFMFLYGVFFYLSETQSRVETFITPYILWVHQWTSSTCGTHKHNTFTLFPPKWFFSLCCMYVTLPFLNNSKGGAPPPPIRN